MRGVVVSGVSVVLALASLVEVVPPGVTVVVATVVVVAGKPVVVVPDAVLSVALVVVVLTPKEQGFFFNVLHKNRMSHLGMFDLRLAGDLEDTRTRAPPAGRYRCVSTAVNHRCRRRMLRKKQGQDQAIR